MNENNYLSKAKPKVSIIVPLYKTEEYIHKCVDSILSQSYENIELVLVDDGSPDNCGVVCDDYARMDSRCLVIHKENGGVSDARNRGLDVCTGDYITFVDSDDWIDKSHIASLMEYAEEGTIVCCGWKDIFSSGGLDTHSVSDKIAVSAKDAIELTQKKYLSNFKEMKKESYDIFSNVVWNKLYPKEIFNNIRFPVGKVYEDGYICFEILMKCEKVISVPVASYNYLIRATSICHTRTAKSVIDLLDSRLKQEIDVAKYPELVKNSKKITLLNCIMIYFEYLRGIVDFSDVEKHRIKSIVGRDKSIIFSCKTKKIIRSLLILYGENYLELKYRIERAWKKLFAGK